MTKRIAIVVLVLAGFGCEIEGYRPTNQELPAPEGAAEAAAIAWAALGGKGELPPVHYVAGLVSGYDWGETRDGEIWLQLDACPQMPGHICRPSQTSLVHELLHCVIDDGLHKDARWETLVPAVKADLRARGL